MGNFQKRRYRLAPCCAGWVRDGHEQRCAAYRARRYNARARRVLALAALVALPFLPILYAWVRA